MKIKPLIQMTAARQAADAARAYALHWPTDEPFYLTDENGQARPLNEIPESVESWLAATALYEALNKTKNPDLRKEVSFYQWQLALVTRGYAPVPHWVMEGNRNEEQFGYDEYHNNPKHEAERERIRRLGRAHTAWGWVQYHRLWPHDIHPSWLKSYEKLVAENYGDNWYAIDYSAIPQLDPDTLLSADANDPPLNPNAPVLLSPSTLLAKEVGATGQ